LVCNAAGVDYLAIAVKDWDRFGRLLEAGALGPITPETAKLVMAARLVGMRNPDLRKQVWDEAVRASGGDPISMRVLLRVSTAWGWNGETEALLWSVVRSDPTQAWAHSALIQSFRSQGDGAKMLDVMTILLDAAPTSRTYRHDWALLSMIVSPHSEWDSSKTIAKEVYLSEPGNLTYALTYGVALSQSGKAEEARVIIEKFPVEEREFPLHAPYMAFIYGCCRRQAEFEKYADLAKKVRLLREESELIDAGRQALNGWVPPADLKQAAKPKPLPSV